ncbi:MAG TPA: hypothetical protein V6D28_16600 [Leptolyngbyaceae cyanobacterium]
MKLNQKQIRDIIIFFVTTIISIINPPIGTFLQICVLIWQLIENRDK